MEVVSPALLIADRPTQVSQSGRWTEFPSMATKALVDPRVDLDSRPTETPGSSIKRLPYR